MSVCPWHVPRRAPAARPYYKPLTRWYKRKGFFSYAFFRVWIPREGLGNGQHHTVLPAWELTAGLPRTLVCWYWYTSYIRGRASNRGASRPPQVGGASALLGLAGRSIQGLFVLASYDQFANKAAGCC
jgi:hypothetical protein